MQSFSQGACARDRKLEFNLATNRSPRKGDVESCETGKIKEGKREGEPKSGEEKKKKNNERKKGGQVWVLARRGKAKGAIEGCS